MKRMFAVTGVALILTAPAIAVPAHAFTEIGPITGAEVNSGQDRVHGDAELADSLQWQKLVARANAARMQYGKVAQPLYFATNGDSATDAMQSSGGSGESAMSRVGSNAQLDNQYCAGGTDIAGGPAHAGGYCLPGGR